MHTQVVFIIVYCTVSGFSMYIVVYTYIYIYTYTKTYALYYIYIIYINMKYAIFTCDPGNADAKLCAFARNVF